MKNITAVCSKFQLSLGLLGLSGCGNNSSVATVADADVNETVTFALCLCKQQPAGN